MPGEDKKIVMNAAVKWVRNDDPDLSNLDDPTVMAFVTVAGVGLSSGILGPCEKGKLLMTR